jgi:hypothetical protein
MSRNVRRSHKLVQGSTDRYGYTMRKTQDPIELNGFKVSKVAHAFWHNCFNLWFLGKFSSVGHNRYISIIELIEIIALYNRMIIRIVRL